VRPKRYRVAVERLTYDEDKAFWLADDAATIARIVRTVPPDRLRGTKFDQWTAVEIIGHIADAAEIFADRVQRCVDEERPEVVSYDQDALAAERRNNERDPMELSRRLSAAHARMIQLLQRPGAAARPAVHSAWGEVDAGHFGAYQADHSHGHASELSAAFPPTV
jgi:DinB family protein